MIAIAIPDAERTSRDAPFHFPAPDRAPEPNLDGSVPRYGHLEQQTPPICSTGAFATCAEAKQLLTPQTKAQVCTQIAEGHCATAAPSAGTSGARGSTCDRQCLQECGGGGGCASVFGC